MITLAYKPYHLPQINMPFEEMFSKLDEEGVVYEAQIVHPNELTPSQGITFSDEITGLGSNKEKPIWVGSNNEILDGHHRYVNHLMNDEPISIIKIQMNGKDACRLLNKIQDIYEYEQNLGVEEALLHQRNINDRNDVANDGANDGAYDSVYEGADDVETDFLSMLEQDNLNDVDDEEERPRNNVKIVAYRRGDVNENSKAGNFFILKPYEGFTKYEIEFDNLLNTNDFGIEYKNSQSPTDVLSKLWFPNVNFQKLSEKYDISVMNLKNRAIAEKAQKLGYDGVQYGDLIIQGLK